MAGRDEEFQKKIEEAARRSQLAGGKIIGNDGAPPMVDPRLVRSSHTTILRQTGMDIGQTNDEEGICRAFSLRLEDFVENHLYIMGFGEEARQGMIEALQNLTPIGERDPDWVDPNEVAPDGE